jgi:energy-coupling factor transporter ATP-binding protein EcfA2
MNALSDSPAANDNALTTLAENEPFAEILAWAKTQPLWRRDALRRMLTGPFTHKDEDDCLELLNSARGLVRSTKVAVPLDTTHLPIRSKSKSNLRLLMLDQIANVNRLAADASLSFACTGLTLIYGDNGSGKTGFVRIFKSACRARDNEHILRDVFTLATRSSSATARFIVADHGAEEPIVWSDGGEPSDKLGRFAVFDSRCASVHVDEENRLEMIPHNLDCFEKLAQLCDRLKSRLKAEAEGLEIQLQTPRPPAPVNSGAARLVSSLGSTTEEALDTAATWSADDKSRLYALSTILRDPVAEAQRLERIAESLKVYTDMLVETAELLSDNSLSRIQVLRQDADRLAHVLSGLRIRSRRRASGS